jgi:hypothetical protein
MHPDVTNPLPEGWEMHVHTQGWIYWVNRERRWVTEHDIRVPSEREQTITVCEEATRGLPDDVEYLHGIYGQTYADHQRRMAWQKPDEMSECRDPNTPLDRSSPFFLSLHFGFNPTSVPSEYGYHLEYWTYIREHPSHHYIGDSEVIPALQWCRVGKRCCLER